MISEKAACNSISSMHNVAFHVSPYGVLDNDHNTFFTNGEHWAMLQNHTVSVQVTGHLKTRRDESSYFMVSDLD